MSEIVNTIRRVAAFADSKEAATFTMADVHFRKGEVFAQSTTGGAIEPIELELECGVSARRLLKALQAVAKDPGFSVDGQLFKVHSGRSTAKLEISAARNAPKFHRPPKKATWEPVPLLHDAHRLAWAVSPDSGRPHLGGIALTKCGIAATNGHVALKLGSEDYHKLLGAQHDLIVSAAVVKGLPSPTFAALDKGRLFLGAGTKPTAFRSANLVDAAFPPMEEVIGGGRTHPRMAVDRKELVDMLKRAKLSAQSAVLEVSGGRLSVRIDDNRDTTLFSFADSISYEPASDEEVPNGTVGLNLGYILLTAETATSEVIQVGMRPTKEGSLDVVYIIDGVLEAVMMPMRQ